MHAPSKKGKVKRQKATDPALVALLEKAGVRQAPFVGSKLVLEELEEMEKPKLVETLKSLGVTELECLRIKHQLRAGADSPTLWQQTASSAKRCANVKDYWLVELSKQDARFVDTFGDCDLKNKNKKHCFF